jgi:hypothetical protein
MTETQTTTAEAKAVTSTLASIKQRYEAHFHQFISHAQLAFAAATARFKKIEDNVETAVSAIPSSFTLEGVKDAGSVDRRGGHGRRSRSGGSGRTADDDRDALRCLVKDLQ